MTSRVAAVPPAIAAVHPDRLHAPSTEAVRRHIVLIALRTARACAILIVGLVALLQAICVIRFKRRSLRARARAAWLHRWCRVACRLLGLQVVSRGHIPQSGLLVCNHLSYLDIIALSSLTPCVFVAKREVARWPLFGWLAAAAGTIFIDRTHRCDSARSVGAIRRAQDDNLLVVLFPEGTSSDGRTVLPFKSALLEAAVQLDRVTAGAIDFKLRDGSVAEEVCYWGDMTLLPHLWRLFGKNGLEAAIRFRRADVIADRKQLATQLHACVQAMRAAVPAIGCAYSADL